MKRFLFFAFVACSLSLLSCSKDDDNQSQQDIHSEQAAALVGTYYSKVDVHVLEGDSVVDFITYDSTIVITNPTSNVVKIQANSKLALPIVDCYVNNDGVVHFNAFSVNHILGKMNVSEISSDLKLVATETKDGKMLRGNIRAALSMEGQPNRVAELYVRANRI